MAGIGDSWGTKEELLHPRGPDGRWIRKAGIAKSAIEAVLGFLAAFRPRTFQNRSQASQYLQNTSRRPGARRMSRADLVRLSSDLSPANADLRDGVIDEPSTKKFVDMMDRSATELPDDVILTRIVGVDAFGFTPETAKGTDSNTDPGIRGVSGKLIAERGYGLTTMGGPEGPTPAGSVRMVIAAKKGTKVIIPAAGPNDTTVFTDREQPLRVTKVAPDGAGGWIMYATAAPEAGGRDVPEPIGGPVGVRQPSKERESRIQQSMQSLAKLDKVPDEEKERAQEQRNAEERAKMGAPAPSPQQEAERRRVEQVSQQPAPGEPAPRTEAPVGRVGEAPAAGAVPATPEAGAPQPTPVPRRAVDLRLAVRDAGIQSPSAGSRRKQWNEAYLGVSSGKKDPVDAIRELDADIKALRNGGEPEAGVTGVRRGTEEDRAADIEAFQGLRDVIAREYGLEETQAPEKRTAAGLPKAERPEPVKTRMSKREQEAEARNKEAAKETPPAPTPVKKAPAKKAAKKATGAPVRTKDQEDRILSQASKLSGPPRNDEERRILDEAAEISARRQGGVTARRQAGTSTEQESPMKVFAKKAPAKKVAKKAAPAELTPEQQREFSDLSPQEQRSYRARRRAGRSHDEALQSARDAVAGRNVQQAEAATGDPLDKMTKKELIAEAGRRGVTARESWTKDRIKKEIRDREKLADESDEQFRREMAEELNAEFEDERLLEQKLQEEVTQKPTPAPVKKAAPRKLNSRNLSPGDRVIWERPGELLVHGVVDQQGTRTFVNWEGGRRERVTSTGDGGMGPDVRRATPEEVEEHGTLGAPREEPRAPAAKASVPGAAPGTAAGKITAGRLQPGMRILVTPEGNPTNRKTGQRTLTIESVDRVTGGRAASGARSSRSRIRIIGRDQDGNQVQVPGDAAPSQTFIVAPEPGAAPAKKAAKAAAPKRMTIGEARRLSAMDAIRDNEVTGGESAAWENISRNVESGDWSIARARKEAKDSARHWRESAGTVRRAGTTGTPEGREKAASRLEGVADKYDKLAEDLTISQSVTKTDKYMSAGVPGAPDKALRGKAKEREEMRSILRRVMDEFKDDAAFNDRDSFTGNNLNEIYQSLLESNGDRKDLELQVGTYLTERFKGSPDRPRPQARIIERTMELLQGERGTKAPDSVERARARQEEIFEAKRFADTAAELDQLITDEASDKAILARFDRATSNQGTTGGAMDVVRARLEAGDRDGARAEMRRILGANGVTPVGNAGDTVKYNPQAHQTIGGTSISEGDTVQIVRPGHRARIGGEDVELGRPVVERVDPVREKGPDLVPEGSVAGPRTETPVDNAPRKRELRQAWLQAEVPTPPPGSGRKSHEEIKGDLVAGRITPEEAIRRYESEVAFNKEDLVEVDAHLRETDLAPAERARVERHRAQLQATIDAHEAQSTFLRNYFKEEAPVVSLQEAKVQDPESYEFLKDATPDDMREAAKQAGLDAPSGDTPDEMFSDLLKQVVRNELKRREAGKAAKKAPAKKVAKKAAPPAVPREKERVDARLLAEGIEGLDDDTIQRVQAYLDGEEVPGSGKNQSPAKIADWLNSTGRGIRDSAAIRFGGWYDRSNPDSPNYDPEFAEQMRLDRAREVARAQAYEELAGRVRGIRRKSVKKAAPAKVAPEVQVREEKIDDLKKRIIDQALEGLQGAKSRDKGDDALEGLTLDELRRLADASGIPPHRSKRGMRDAILAHFFPEQPVTLDQFRDLPSREAAHELLAPLNRDQLARLARQLSVPGASSASKESLRREIVEGTTGRRLDSIAIRGFEGARPGLGDVQGRPDLPVGTSTPRPMPLSRRASGAGIATPSRFFSDVDSAVSDADARLRAGESPTLVARGLRERAARVAKADIMEEGRRFPTELDRDSLISIRKSNAEYLRRVATHVQQEGKASTPAKKAAKKAAPELPPPGEFLELARAERPFTEPSPSRTGTSPVGGDRSTAAEIPNNWGMLGTGGDVEFHADGVVGQGLERMGQDRLMDVDGEPLSNVVGKLATRAVRGQISQEQLLDELQRLAQRLPEGSAARRGINSMIKDLDAPSRPMPKLPDGTPAPFRTALEGLLQIPVAREAVDRPGFHRSRDDSEVDKLLKLMEKFQEGRTGGLRMINEIQEMRGSLPHESQEGRFEADRVLRQLHDDLDALYKDKDTRSQVMRREPGAPPPPAPAKKATPRLTAIPGGGAGSRRKRPNLTVVRNENGEFSLVAVP